MRGTLVVRKVLLSLVLVPLGFALTADLPAVKHRHFLSDEATYFAMAQSIAYDGDLIYSRADLERVVSDFPGGPQGIFLKRTRIGEGNLLFYAKGYIYPLLASPFVRVLGTKGFLTFHACLLALMLWAGARFWGRQAGEGPALAWTATFLFASASALYFFWLTPEFLNLSLVFLATALWMPRPDEDARDAGLARDLGAVALYALATFLKPFFTVLAVGPLLLTRARGWRDDKRRLASAALLALAFAAMTGGLAWMNRIGTGEMNYQGGDRKTFYHRYPLEDPAATFESLGETIRTDTLLFDPADLVSFLRGWPYYFFGRFGGVVWYFFPIVPAAIAFARRPSLFPRGLVAATILAMIGASLFVFPFNYVGGGGVVGNRYFLGILPLFFFLPSRAPGRRAIAACWIAAAILLAPALTNPFPYSADPAALAKQTPLRFLPWNGMLLGAIPTNTNPKAFKIPFGSPPRLHLYFLDDDSWGKETGGFWVRGGAEAETALRTDDPIESLAVRVTNGPRAGNEVRVRLGGARWRGALEPNGTVEIRLEPRRGFRYGRAAGTDWLYRFTVSSSDGFVPAIESGGGRDKRTLGVRVEFGDLVEREEAS